MKARELECLAFAEHMTVLGLNFTKYKQYLTRNKKWGMYPSIHSRVRFTDYNGRFFIKDGLTTEDYKYIKRLISHSVNKKYIAHEVKDYKYKK